MEDEFTFDYLLPLDADDARALQARALEELPEGKQRAMLVARFKRIEQLYESESA